MKKIILMATLLAATFLYACKEDNKVTNQGPIKFNVKITDAPGAYDSVLLSVKEIQVLTSEGQSTLPVGNQPFDILKFRLGKDTLIASQDIPAGQLQEIRLVLNPTGNRVVVDGQSYNLTTPSGQQSGVKIKIQDELTAGTAYTLKLDFDAARSIVTTGNGKYILKPVIRAIPHAVAISAGTIAGVISPAKASPKIYAIAGTDTLGTVSDAQGKFYFSNVIAGTYKIEIIPTSPYYGTQTIPDVVVSNGSINDLGIIYLRELDL